MRTPERHHSGGLREALKVPEYKEYLLINAAVMAAFLILFLAGNDCFAFLLKKEGIVEIINEIVLVVAGLNFISMYLKEKKYFYLLLAAVSFLVFLEEIDWGQLIIGFDTPAIVLNLNEVTSFNFHNKLRNSGFDLYLLYYWGAAFYFCVLPAILGLVSKLGRSYGYLNEKMKRLVLPSGIVSWVVFCWLLYSVIISRAGSNDQELVECMYSVALVYLHPRVRANLNRMATAIMQGRPARR